VSRNRLVMIATVARLLAERRHAAVGAASPIPAAGALLARELTGRPRVSLLGSRRNNPFTDGSRELFDCAAQGRIDAFFLGGAQIDGRGNVNLLGLGRYPALTRRFSGSFGAPFMAAVVPNLILFREGHERRALVERVDFVSAAGSGNVRWLLTERCLFRFDGSGFALASLHPGETLQSVRDATGFAYTEPTAPPATEPPSPEVLAVLRGPVREALAEAYPRAATLLEG
jgi:glutaconate CoA-transferase subunit B